MDAGLQDTAASQQVLKPVFTAVHCLFIDPGTQAGKFQTKKGSRVIGNEYTGARITLWHGS